MAVTTEERLEGFLAEYDSEIAAQAREALEKMHRLLPGMTRLVYDNYNALVIGFCVGERPSSGIFSIAVYPRYVTLFFLKGAGLPDPAGLLGGSGNVVRQLRLDGAESLDRPEIRALIAAELDRHGVNPNTGSPGPLIIQSISANRRPRRPGVKPPK